MTACFSWGYFLKKLGIRRERVRPAITDAPKNARERRRQDLPKMPDLMMQVQHQLQKSDKYDVSLLHPDWRRFPHAPLYGWTNDHAQHLKHLNYMIVNGNLESAYYNSEVEYRAARIMNNFTILPRPNVSNVNEAVLLLRRSQGFHHNSCCHESLVEYDADDESDKFCLLCTGGLSGLNVIGYINYASKEPNVQADCDIVKTFRDLNATTIIINLEDTWDNKPPFEKKNNFTHARGYFIIL